MLSFFVMAFDSERNLVAVSFYHEVIFLINGVKNSRWNESKTVNAK